MRKLVIALVAATVVVVFAMDNMHHVEMGHVVGGIVRVRLFWLMLCSFLAGCFLTTVANMYINSKAKSEGETEREAVKTADAEEYFS